MKFDLQTLVFILSLTCLTQVVAIFIQYRLNRTFRGIGWWLCGSSSMALGFIFLSVGIIKVIGFLSVLGNPLLILGRVCIFIGVAQFIGKKVNHWAVAVGFLCSMVIYYYYLFGHVDIAARTVVVSAAIAAFSLLTAYYLYTGRQNGFSGSARYTGSVFCAHGLYLLVVIGYTLTSKPIHSFHDFAPIQVAAFIVPTLSSVLWTFGLILMVSQRLSAEILEEKEMLRESEAIYRSILDASPDDITFTDLDGRVLLVSPAANAMFRYPPGAETGLNLLDCIVADDRDRARSNIKRMFEGSSQGTHEYKGLRQDGSVFDIEVNSGVIRGMHGQPVRMVFIVRDITERRKVDAEKADLEAKNSQLQKAESLGRMAGAIAHHFNNQLQAVMGNLELAGGIDAGQDAIPWLGKAKQATERAAGVSRMMLAYLGKTSREQEPQFLGEVCRRCLPILLTSLPTTVTFASECPDPGPVISADANQIQEILSCLIANAQEALGDAKGSIRFAIGIHPAAEIPAVHRFPVDWQPRAQAYASMEVADDGSGIPSADMEKLFDPFFSTKFTGRGLGLSVVLGLVQAHGGAVTVRSELGRGSLFRVYFPVLEEASPAPARGEVSASPGEWGGVVLLVDDDEIVLSSTGALLERMGFTVLTAMDGVEAMAAFHQRSNDIRCVITDLSMPRMDGWETLAALRQLKPDLPVILASGYGKAQILSTGHVEHPQAFLGKPFSFRQLRDTLGQVLGISGEPQG